MIYFKYRLSITCFFLFAYVLLYIKSFYSIANTIPVNGLIKRQYSNYIIVLFTFLEP